jgi:hypothetical protein
MGRAVVHFEIGCKDNAKTQEFYKKLFHWKIEAMGPAAMIAAEAGGIGGHITALGHGRIITRFFMWTWTTWPRIWRRRNRSAGKCSSLPWRFPPARLPGCRIPKAIQLDCGRRRNSAEYA